LDLIFAPSLDGRINFGVTAMDMKRRKTSTEEFEKAALKQDRAKYVLRLYVTGMTPKSTQALANVQKLCEEHLAGCYELKVIDIYQQPKLAKGEQIIATPTLIKKLPLPLRKLIGDMSDTERFLVGIDLKPKEFMSKKQ
jgi:circadian clock protein KaiB